MEGFKNYLFNEEKGHLGKRVNNILTAAQELQGDAENLGSRKVTRLADEIVNQVRSILHDQWTPRQKKHLENLVKVGVALKKSIEEKDTEYDVKEILPSVVQELESLATKLGVKVNALTGPPEEAEAPLESPPEEEMAETPPEMAEMPPEAAEAVPPEMAPPPEAGMPPVGIQPPAAPPG